MTKKERKKMSQIGDRLRALADEVDKMAQSPATAPKEEKPVASTPTLTNVPTPTGAPAIGRTAKVSLLVDTARAEAGKLREGGESMNHIDEQLSLVLTAKDNRTAKDIAHSILDLLRPMKARVDVSALWHAVQRIEGELDDSSTGIVGDTDVTGDMSGGVGG